MLILKSFWWATLGVFPLFVAFCNWISNVFWEKLNLPAAAKVVFYISYGFYVLLPNIGIGFLLLGTYFTIKAFKERNTGVKKGFLVLYSFILLWALVYDCWWYGTNQTFDAL